MVHLTSNGLRKNVKTGCTNRPSPDRISLSLRYSIRKPPEVKRILLLGLLLVVRGRVLEVFGTFL